MQIDVVCLFSFCLYRTHTQHTVIKCYFVTLHVASRGFNFSLSLTLSSIYCALHTRFIQIKLSPKFHTNAYFVVFCSCAFANLMTHSKHTHTHTYRDIHTVTAIKYTTGQRNQFSYLHKAFLLTFNSNSLFLMYFTWFCFLVCAQTVFIFF